MKTAYLAIGLGLFGLLAACSPKEVVDNRYNGYVEAEYVYIAAPDSGWLTQLNVRQGDRVDRGKLLFELDKERQQLTLQQSEQVVRQAQAKSYDLQQGARPEEIEVLKAQLAEARANELLAKLEKDRTQKLVKSGSASASTLDQLMASWRAAQARVATIQSNIQVAELAAREHTLEVAVAQQKAAEAVRDEVNWQLQQRTVLSRREGRVEDVFHRLGEYVNAGTPVVMLLPDDALKVRFYLPQHELSQLQPGSQIQVYRDGQSQAVSAQVSFISDVAEFTPPVIFSSESRDKLVYRVEAQLNTETLHPGQPVDVVLP